MDKTERFNKAYEFLRFEGVIRKQEDVAKAMGAGSIWLNNGIPLEVVSRCLGHSSLVTTQKAYAKILDKTIAEAFAKK